MSACEGVLSSVPLQADMDDGEEQEYGRIIPLGEFIERLKARADIFTMDKESRLSKMEAACIALAFAAGLMLVTREALPPPQMIPPSTQRPIETPITAAQTPVVVKGKTYTIVPRVFLEKRTLKKPSAHALSRLASSASHGVGSPTARIARMKAFAMIARRLSGKTASGVDGGTAISGIDKGMQAVLLGTMPLKQGGQSWSGRRTVEGIGTSPGFDHSGFSKGYGDGSGDPLADLMAADAAPLDLHQRHHASLASIDRQVQQLSGVLTGGRSKSSIKQTVMENIGSIRYAYNKWLRQHPDAAGKITVKFAIDEFGNVIFCDVLTATLQGSELSDQVISIVKTWNFGKIDKPGDITEAVYPLVFSM